MNESNFRKLVGVQENRLLSVQMVEIYVPFFVSDTLALFVEAVTRTRTVGQIPYGVLRRTFATAKKHKRFTVIFAWTCILNVYPLSFNQKLFARTRCRFCGF